MISRICVGLVVLTVLGCATVPRQPDQSYFAIEEAGAPKLIVTSHQNGTGVGIFQEGSGSPYVSVLDSNSDGVLDYIEYFVLDVGGGILKHIEDYGFDGQPDLVVDYRSKTAKVFIEGKWYPIDGVGTAGRKTVEIGDVVRPLEEIVEKLRAGRY